MLGKLRNLRIAYTRLEMRSRIGLIVMLVGLTACGTPQKARELHVAAAANLTKIMPAIDTAFERESGVHVVPTFGSTAQLTQQIENGAPVDILMAADVAHVDELKPTEKIVYTRGRLVVWAPQATALHSLEDLASVKAIAIAKPELAPYGAAAVEVLHNAHLWEKLEPKVVYASSIAAAKQLADTGNADAAFTAAALVPGEKGNAFPVNPALHTPIDQAACVTKQASDSALARQFLDFLKSEQMQTLFRRYGYMGV